MEYIKKDEMRSKVAEIEPIRVESLITPKSSGNGFNFKDGLGPMIYAADVHKAIDRCDVTDIGIDIGHGDSISIRSELFAWATPEEIKARRDRDSATLNALARDIHANAVEHGFWETPPTFGEVIALCHSELSEALEAYRDGQPDVWIDKGKPEGTAVEMADCLIRILDYMGAADIDVEQVVKLKQNYNRTRPYKHGGKKI